LTESALHEVEIETRWEAAPAVAVAILLQVALAISSETQGWTTWVLSWWMWLFPVVPETLFIISTFSRPHHALMERGIRREAGIVLVALASLGNAFLVLAVIASLVSGHETSGSHLLLKGAAVWLPNVILFGLWFWIFDRGGPASRIGPSPPSPDFQFPQMENPDLAAPNWRPHFVDYMYVSFTNSIAFSPTDAMPLNRWAKLLMLLEASISALVILLVAARSVNIFKS
jgi:hypothetical protein